MYGVARTKIATTILLQVTYERSWGRMYNISRKEERGALDFNGAGMFVIFANIYHLSEAPSRCSTETILKTLRNLLFSTKFQLRRDFIYISNILYFSHFKINICDLSVIVKWETRRYERLINHEVTLFNVNKVIENYIPLTNKVRQCIYTQQKKNYKTI